MTTTPSCQPLTTAFLGPTRHIYYPSGSDKCAYCGEIRPSSPKTVGLAQKSPKPITETDVAAGMAVGTLIGAAAVVGALVLAVIPNPKEDKMKKKIIGRCGTRTIHTSTNTSLTCEVIKGHTGQHYATDKRGVGWVWTGAASSLREDPKVPSGWTPFAFRAHVGFAVVEVTQRGCWVWTATTADGRVKRSKIRHRTLDDAKKAGAAAARMLPKPRPQEPCEACREGRRSGHIMFGCTAAIRRQKAAALAPPKRRRGARP